MLTLKLQKYTIISVFCYMVTVSQKLLPNNYLSYFSHGYNFPKLKEIANHYFSFLSHGYSLVIEIEPFHMHFELLLFLSTAAMIGWNKSRDLSRQLLAVVHKKSSNCMYEDYIFRGCVQIYNQFLFFASSSFVDTYWPQEHGIESGRCADIAKWFWKHLAFWVI